MISNCGGCNPQGNVSGDVVIGGGITAEFTMGTFVPDQYTGSYEVIPKIVSQTLPTQFKTMRDDVLVHPIPYYETHNESGMTAIIGE